MNNPPINLHANFSLQYGTENEIANTSQYFNTTAAQPRATSICTYIKKTPLEKRESTVSKVNTTAEPTTSFKDEDFLIHFFTPSKVNGTLLPMDLCMFIIQLLRLKEKLNIFSVDNKHRKLLDFSKTNFLIVLSLSEYLNPNIEKLEFATKHDLMIKMTNSEEEKIRPKTDKTVTNKDSIRQRTEIIHFENPAHLSSFKIPGLAFFPKLSSVYYNKLSASDNRTFNIQNNPNLKSITIDQCSGVEFRFSKTCPNLQSISINKPTNSSCIFETDSDKKLHFIGDSNYNFTIHNKVITQIKPEDTTEHL